MLDLVFCSEQGELKREKTEIVPVSWTGRSEVSFRLTGSSNLHKGLFERLIPGDLMGLRGFLNALGDYPSSMDDSFFCPYVMRK